VVGVLGANKKRTSGPMGREMDYSDYLRERAAEYRQLAEASGNPTVRQDLFESAAIYEEVANDVDDRRTGG
jgi:hypothetical protein